MDDPTQPQMPDMGALLGMAMEMQNQLAVAQEQAAATIVEGQAGGGAVRIEVSGGYEFRSVTISPDALDPDDVEMLQDLVLAALNDAIGQVNELNQTANPLAGLGLGAGGDLGGLDFGGIDLGDLGLGGPAALDAQGVGGLGAQGFDMAALAGTTAADDPALTDEDDGNDGPGTEAAGGSSAARG